MFNALIFLVFLCREQPPSGGCVLKLIPICRIGELAHAAAFGRLCVETPNTNPRNSNHIAAAFGRLCVETIEWILGGDKSQAAAFGRLCVETTPRKQFIKLMEGSRLRAAVC